MLSRLLAARRARRAERKLAWAIEDAAVREYLARRARELEAAGVARVRLDGDGDDFELVPVAPGAAAVEVDFGPGPYYLYLSFPVDPAGGAGGPFRFAEMFGGLEETERLFEALIDGRVRWRFKPARTMHVEWLEPNGERFLLSTSLLGLRQGEVPAEGRAAPYGESG
ncbi:MAG: hypothetical protein PGN13_11575 [Patulibacter minatonensis]